MKRTTIFLPDEVHKNLKYMALGHNVSMAELLREAVESVYKEAREDLQDIQLAKQARIEHKKNPKRTVEAAVFFSEKKKRD